MKIKQRKLRFADDIVLLSGMTEMLMEVTDKHLANN